MANKSALKQKVVSSNPTPQRQQGYKITVLAQMVAVKPGKRNYQKKNYIIFLDN